MSAGATPTTLLTTEDLLAMPDDGYDRELIRGELREKPMTKRNKWHSSTEARIAHVLNRWLEAKKWPGFRVVSGEAGFRLMRDPETTVGVDVALVSADVVNASPESSPYFRMRPGPRRRDPFALRLAQGRHREDRRLQGIRGRADLDRRY